MNIKPIKSQQDYHAALDEIEKLFDAVPGTPKGDRLDVLVTLVEAYETKNYAIELPDPIEQIKHVMEAKGLTRKDLEQCIGSRARISEILGRKRKLTLSMIRKLHTQLRIPADVLIHI